MNEILSHHSDIAGQRTTPLIIAVTNGNEAVVDVLHLLSVSI